MTPFITILGSSSIRRNGSHEENGLARGGGNVMGEAIIGHWTIPEAFTPISPDSHPSYSSNSLQSQPTNSTRFSISGCQFVPSPHSTPLWVEKLKPTKRRQMDGDWSSPLYPPPLGHPPARVWRVLSGIDPK